MSTMPPENDEELPVDDVHSDVLAAMQQLQAEPREEAPDGRAGRLSTEPSDDGPKDTRGERDAFGRFTPRAKVDGEQPAAIDAAADPAAPPPVAPEASVAPPPSWGVAAKTAWANLPPEVRAEIGKREVEVSNGLKALTDYKDLAPYAEMARSKGTSIKGALDHYLGFDQELQRDLTGGIAQVAESYGASPAELARMFGELAARYGGGQPQAAQQGDDDSALRELLTPYLKPLLDEVAQLRQGHQQRADADRNAQATTLKSAVDSFAADPKNVYYANVEADIARLFQGRVVPLTGNPVADLQAAYDMAVYMNPQTRRALIEQQAAADQDRRRQADTDKAAKARAASRSLGGSRISGATITEAPRASGHDDIEADVRAAFRAHSS